MRWVLSTKIYPLSRLVSIRGKESKAASERVYCSPSCGWPSAGASTVRRASWRVPPTLTAAEGRKSSALRVSEHVPQRAFILGVGEDALSPGWVLAA